MPTMDSQNERRGLSAAIDTPNSDRLFRRVTGLEHGRNSVTGAIRQAERGDGFAESAAA